MTFKTPRGATALKDVSGLRLDWVLDQETLNEVESENILKAAKKYLYGNIPAISKWFNTTYIVQVHAAMFEDVWDWAGTFRTTQTNIGSKPYKIRSEIDLLCEDVSYWNTAVVDLPIIEQAVRIHHRLVQIHPFPNGNGRHARLIADRYLRCFKHEHPVWPVEIYRSSSLREQYLQALREADRGDFTALVKYTIDCGACAPN